MAFVIIDGERYALDSGETILGGSGEGRLDAREIAHLPGVVVIDFPISGPTTARSLGALPVMLNGAALDGTPQTLRHGDRMEVAGLGIAYGDIRKAGRTAHVSAVKRPTSPADLLQGTHTAPSACTGGKVMRLADRAEFAVPEGGLTLGRDPSCDVILTSDGISRRHASIAPSLLGYTLKDTSTNGVWVNGAKVEGSHVLGVGDVLRLGGEEFRFEADEASFELLELVPEMPLAAPVAANTVETPAVAAPEPAPVPTREVEAALLATLEVLSEGAMKGQRFRLDRPTVQLGRGPHNEVRLNDDSVSTTHASLVQRGNRWVILDLGSRNGSFVEGEIVREQRELPNICELRLGMLVMLFRVINARPSVRSSTINVIAGG
jgi:pSer/pThr/pTyr-binding forkhead associated (FHA) protein